MAVGIWWSIANIMPLRFHRLLIVMLMIAAVALPVAAQHKKKPGSTSAQTEQAKTEQAKTEQAKTEQATTTTSDSFEELLKKFSSDGENDRYEAITKIAEAAHPRTAELLTRAFDDRHWLV